MKFAQIIRSSKAVRTAFDKTTAHRWWWRAVLALHGKPYRDDLSPADRKRILSNGFRFYAILYTLLAVVMLAVSVLLLVIIEGLYWPGMALLASAYLGGSSALAFRGAYLYPSDMKNASALLVVFFVSVVGFLMLFGGALAVFINQHRPAYGVLGLLLLAVFVLFGVGSYLIEILYLFHISCSDEDD
ncbi:MAG: hypothetical protein JW818_11650 [Pirellulales bacterium]|nr:hypothetical protein [Pirellulales bacterium]